MSASHSAYFDAGDCEGSVFLALATSAADERQPDPSVRADHDQGAAGFEHMGHQRQWGKVDEGGSCVSRLGLNWW